MVRWRAVPKDLSTRLRKLHEEIMKFFDSSQRSELMDHFGIDWSDLDDHTGNTIKGLRSFVEAHSHDGVPDEKTLGTIYALGFLTGVRFAVEEDHEPPNHN